MGYATFYRLRRDAAYAYGKEYGDHYAKIIGHQIGSDRAATEAYNRETERLIRKYKIPERFLVFLYQSDVDGHLSPFQCKAVCEATKNLDQDKTYGYAGWDSKHQMTMGKFRELLNTCYEKRKYLVWM